MGDANEGDKLIARMGKGEGLLGDIVAKFIDGKGTTQVVMPFKGKVISGFAVLEEVPDSLGTTYTVKVTDGTNDITDTLTFTEGTDSAGTLKNFTVDQSYYEFEKGDTINIVTSGTTTTKGELDIVLFLERTG